MYDECCFFHLAELPKYTNYAYVVGAVVIVVGIWGRRQGWGEKYRKYVFQVDSWFLGAIALLILGISAEKQLDLFNGSGFSLWNVGVAYFLILGIMLPTPLFMLADWIAHTEDRIKIIGPRRKSHTIFDMPGATPVCSPTLSERARELIRKVLE